jgi:hypothetical protein
MVLVARMTTLQAEQRREANGNHRVEPPTVKKRTVPRAGFHGFGWKKWRLLQRLRQQRTE